MNVKNVDINELIEIKANAIKTGVQETFKKLSDRYRYVASDNYRDIFDDALIDANVRNGGDLLKELSQSLDLTKYNKAVDAIGKNTDIYYRTNDYTPAGIRELYKFIDELVGKIVVEKLNNANYQG